MKVDPYHSSRIKIRTYKVSNVKAKTIKILEKKKLWKTLLDIGLHKIIMTMTSNVNASE